jgi:hypothetical protein
MIVAFTAIVPPVLMPVPMMIAVVVALAITGPGNDAGG